MKFKDIVGCILMVVFSVSGIILSFGSAINLVISSDGIIDCMLDVSYLERTTYECNTVLGHYMDSDTVEEILKKISVTSHIKQIIKAFDTNDIEAVATNIKNEMKQVIIGTLDEDTTAKSKESHATIVSEAYVKNLFPIKEFSVLSDIYQKYSSKLNLVLVSLAILSLCIYIYLANGKKTYKWAIIALYNIIILNLMLVLTLGGLDSIFIGNERTTDVIINMLGKIKINVIISTLIVLVIAVISNYIAYFRKRKHSR